MSCPRTQCSDPGQGSNPVNEIHACVRAEREIIERHCYCAARVNSSAKKFSQDFFKPRESSQTKKKMPKSLNFNSSLLTTRLGFKSSSERSDYQRTCFFVEMTFLVKARCMVRTYKKLNVKMK